MSNLVKFKQHMLKQSSINDGSLTTQPNEWLTTDDVSSIYKLPIQSVRNMTSNGTLPVYKLGNRNRYSRSEIDAILLQNKRG